jgi:cell division protein FtsB
MLPFIGPLSLRQQAAIAGTVLVVGFGVGLASDPRGLRLWWRLGDDVGRLDTENAKLRGDIDGLRRKVLALRGDPKSLERAARESGYVRDDEILFELR